MLIAIFYITWETGSLISGLDLGVMLIIFTFNIIYNNHFL